MKTQLFKARDMKTAMNLVNDEYGDKAIILSTKRNNGVVEVEASDNDKVIETHKKKVEEKKNFSKVFNKEIITPGIRFNSKTNDQIRTLTPKQAYKNGSDWLVIGRPITKGNIKKNIQKLIDHLSK